VVGCGAFRRVTRKKPGRGRPRGRKIVVPLDVQIAEETKARIAREANAAGISESEFARRVIERGTKEKRGSELSP